MGGSSNEDTVLSSGSWSPNTSLVSVHCYMYCMYMHVQVSGPTLYNMLRLNDVSTNMEDHPLDPPKILKTEVLSNPFDDIVPRVDSRRLDKRKEKAKSQSKATKYVSYSVSCLSASKRAK